MSEEHKQKVKALNEQYKQELALEQGALLTEIIKQAEYGNDAGLLIEVGKAQTILNEAKTDFGLDRLIFSKEQMERQLKSGELTQVEKAFVEICLKLIKWFGDSQTNANQQTNCVDSTIKEQI